MYTGKMWPHYLLAGTLGICLLASGCKSKAMGAPPPMGPMPVSVLTITAEPVVLTTQLPGRTSAYLTAEIRPQVNGIIKERNFQEGALVRAGELLYRIDPAPYEATYGQARANLATSEADLANAEANLPSLEARAGRYRELVAIHAVGQQDYDDARAALTQAQATVSSRKAAVEAAKAAVETAKINLGYTPLKAPISGRIGKSNITVGGLTSSYQATALATIQQLDPMYVDVVQANSELLRLRSNLESGKLRSNGGQQRNVKLLLEDGTEYSQQGALQFRDVTVDPTTGAVTVRIVFPNPKEILLPGMFVRAVVEEGVREQALLVPQQAVGRDPKGNPFVWVVGADNKAVQRPVELERAIGSRWLVLNGLNSGDRVVMEGKDHLQQGAPVMPMPFKDIGVQSQGPQRSENSVAKKAEHNV